MDTPAPIACPDKVRNRILLAFARQCRKHLGTHPRSGHPCAAEVLWQLAGGRLGDVLSACERVARDAAAQGFRELDLAVVANDWLAR